MRYEVIRRLWRSITDSVPPYRRTKGLLEAKDADGRGRFYLVVGPVKVEVDRPTFDALVVGEHLRVLHTPGNRAISVDRLVRPEGRE